MSQVSLFLLLALLLLKTAGGSSGGSCDWKDRSNFYSIRAILENKIRANSTLLFELAGVFSNKHRPLKQVIVHYQILIPVSDEECEIIDCDLKYDEELDNDTNCPVGFHCVSADFIWGRYPATAQDTVFRDLDVCPLVIGDYEQREVTIYFTFQNPPSCNVSAVDNNTILREELPCGWNCNLRRQISPSSGDPSEPIFRASEKESPLDRALLGITAKLLQYSTDKESLPSLQYDINDAFGYAAPLGTATYFDPALEYAIFISAYTLLHVIIAMMVFQFRNQVYIKVFAYATKTRVQGSLFWSAILTFFVFFFNLTLVFFIEGGACITLLQLYIGVISLLPMFLYPFIIFFIEKNTGFFRAFDVNIDPKRIWIKRLDHFVQSIAIFFVFIVPHIFVLIFYLASVSFFHNANSTTFLVLYFTSSSVILWIANAIVVYLVFPYVCVCRAKPYKKAAKEVIFSICLGLSFNLMNLSILPFVGDFYYDNRADGSTVFSIIPLVITFVGWYLSGELVEGFSKLSFDSSDLKKKINKKLPKSKKAAKKGKEHTDHGDEAITDETNAHEMHIVIEEDTDRGVVQPPSVQDNSADTQPSNRLYNFVKAYQYFHRLNSPDVPASHSRQPANKTAAVEQSTKV